MSRTILETPRTKRRKKRQERMPPKKSPLNICHTVVGTDTQFISQNRSEPFAGNKAMQELLKANAKAAGIPLTGNEMYSPQLASGPAAADGIFTDKADVERICRQKGCGVKGWDGDTSQFDIDPVFPEREEKPYRVADEITEEYVDDELAASGIMPDDISHQEYSDLFESTQKRLSGAMGEE